jgi:hypothetical protein
MRITHHFQDSDRKIPKLYAPNPDWVPPKASLIIEKYLSRTGSSIHSPLLRQTKHHEEDDLYLDITTAFKALCEKSEVRIESTDKNLGPILVDTEMSIAFTLEHLVSPTFQEISAADSTELLLTFMKGVQTLIETHSIDDTTAHFLTAHFTDTPSPSKFKLLIKIHKAKLGTRPILASTSFVSTNLSKWIDSEVAPFINDIGYSLRNSQQLLKDLNSLDLSTPTILFTADVKALYPSIPIDDGIDLFREFLIHHTTLSQERITLIIAALTLVLKHNVTSALGRYFLQIIGTAMGTPCAVVFANVFMFMICKDVRHHDLILLFRRYIDDIFMVAHYTPNTANTIFTLLNNLHPSITFPASDFHHSRTSVNMLDVTIYREKASCTSLSYKLFTKPLNRFLYIPFFSFHSKSTLKGFITGELIRISTLSSNFTNFSDSANLFFTHLIARDYPSSFLHPLFQMSTWPHVPTPPPASTSSIPLLFHATLSPNTNHSTLKSSLSRHHSLLQSDFTASILFPNPPMICWRNPNSFGKFRNKLQKRI